MKALSILLSATVDRRLLSGFSVGFRNNNELLMSHLLFADALISWELNLDHLYLLPCLFLCFEAVSGLKINLAKLELVLVGVVEDVGSLASIFDCKVSSLPMNYQGLPLGALFRAKSIWNGIMEMIKSRLAGLEVALFVKGW